MTKLSIDLFGFSRGAAAARPKSRKVEGKDVCLGTFDMAVEAAVAYARSVALAQPVHCTPITRRPASFDARLNALERVVQARMAQEMPISPITRVDHCEASAAAPTFSSQGIAMLEAAFALNEFPSAEQRRAHAATAPRPPLLAVSSGGGL